MYFFGTILAADKNEIDGTNKFLLELGTKSVLSNLATQMSKTRVKEWSVVVGFDYDLHKRQVENLPLRTVIDPDWALGFASQVKIGLHEMPPQAVGFIVLPGDMPFFNKNTMNLLLDALDAEKGFIIVPKSGDEIFPFPLFHRKMLGEVIDRLGEGNFYQMIIDHSFETYDLEIDDPSTLMRIIDKESYIKAKEIFFRRNIEPDRSIPQKEIPE